VARSLIDTLGAIALAAVDAPASTKEERHGGSGSISSSRDDSVAADRDTTPVGGAFGLAVDELARMSGEDGGDGRIPEGAAVDVQGWAMLGLPLR